MKILFATSEATPFVKTGGLGDVAGTLPGELNKLGADARVILPLYNGIPQEYKDRMTYINHIYIDMAWRKQYCGVFLLEHNGTKFYFVDNKFYFGGNHPYSYIHEDVEKFIFFSKAVLSLLPTLDFRPDVINCNDWQTGPIPVFLDTFQDNPFFRGIKTVMTIHNLKFQGRWDLKGIKDVMGISDYYFTSDKLEYYKDANLLKGGLVYADKISTVSESYAGEITTYEYGEGLNGLLSARRHDTVGIVNGISYDEYNPETDNFIYEKYNSKNIIEKKAVNKQRLQQELNLPQDSNKFMIGIVSRLTEQKGFDILAQALEQLCQSDIQIVVLGTGDENFENMFRHFAWKYPDKVSANIYFSNELAHKIYAGCDAFLMPSRFEPCGLSQLISLRYGTIPIVRETGGLKDTVIPYNEYDGQGTGFSFGQYSAQDMLHVVRYAHSVYTNPKAWQGIINNALSVDFSWNVSAKKYMQMYRDLTGIQEIENYDDNNNVGDEKKSDESVAEKKTPVKRTRKTAAKKTEEKKAEEKTAEKKKTTAKRTKKSSENAESAIEAADAVKETAAVNEAAAVETEKTVKEEKPKRTRKTTKSAKKTEETEPVEEKSAKEEKQEKKETAVEEKIEKNDDGAVKTEVNADAKAEVKTEEVKEIKEKSESVKDSEKAVMTEKTEKSEEKADIEDKPKKKAAKKSKTAKKK